MLEATFIQFDGKKITCECEEGESLMSVAINNFVEGIDGDCGGGCSCATCHVYVDSEWLKSNITDASEEALLSLNPDRENNSRLSCQIAMKEELNGIVVRIPEFQY